MLQINQNLNIYELNLSNLLEELALIYPDLQTQVIGSCKLFILITM